MPTLDLKQLSQAVQRRLVAQLEEGRNLPHPTLKGNEGELAWQRVLGEHLPRRYAVRGGFILDSRGETSEQIDIIIYDPQYTPVWFTQQGHAFVLAEAVYAVFEVKQELNAAHLTYAGEKAASVRRLHRTSAPVVHSDGKRPPKTPFRILAGILALKSGWINPADHLERVLDSQTRSGGHLDLGIALEAGFFETEQERVQFSAGPECLVLFLYRLLDLLQQRGTVPAINWNAYVAHLRSQL